MKTNLKIESTSRTNFVWAAISLFVLISSAWFGAVRSADAPVLRVPVVREPVIREPVIREPVIREPVVREPVVREPVIRAPVVRTPVIRTPVVRTPVVRTPVVRTPAKSTPTLRPALTAPAPRPAIKSVVKQGSEDEMIDLNKLPATSSGQFGVRSGRELPAGGEPVPAKEGELTIYDDNDSVLTGDGKVSPAGVMGRINAIEGADGEGAAEAAANAAAKATGATEAAEAAAAKAAAAAEATNDAAAAAAHEAAAIAAAAAAAGEPGAADAEKVAQKAEADAEVAAENAALAASFADAAAIAAGDAAAAGDDTDAAAIAAGVGLASPFIPGGSAISSAVSGSGQRTGDLGTDDDGGGGAGSGDEITNTRRLSGDRESEDYLPAAALEHGALTSFDDKPVASTGDDDIGASYLLAQLAALVAKSPDNLESTQSFRDLAREVQSYQATKAKVHARIRLVREQIQNETSAEKKAALEDMVADTESRFSTIDDRTSALQTKFLQAMERDNNMQSFNDMAKDAPSKNESSPDETDIDTSTGSPTDVFNIRGGLPARGEPPDPDEPGKDDAVEKDWDDMTAMEKLSAIMKYQHDTLKQIIANMRS